MIRKLVNLHNTIENKYPKLSKVGRYILSGGSAAFVDLLLLYVLTDLFHVWYLVSAIIAFIVAFFVSFFLQKHWTFRDGQAEGVHKQMAAYLLIALINLGINTFLMFVCVHYLKWHYMASQFVVAGLIACASFFVYRKFIFKNEKLAN